MILDFSLLPLDFDRLSYHFLTIRTIVDPAMIIYYAAINKLVDTMPVHSFIGGI